MSNPHLTTQEEPCELRFDRNEVFVLGAALAWYLTQAEASVKPEIEALRSKVVTEYWRMFKADQDRG